VKKPLDNFHRSALTNIAMLLERREIVIPELKRSGELLDIKTISKSGDLELDHYYYRGNMGYGKHQPKDKGWSGSDESIVRTLNVSEALRAETAFVLNVPGKLDAEVTLLDKKDKFSDIHAREIDFLYIPAGFQVHGRIGDTNFLTDDGRTIQYGGRLAWAGNHIKNKIIMYGGGYSVINENNPVIPLLNTGIVASYWPK
jgi:hypothetical protein